MSNLKLPVMTFDALAKNVKPGQTRKLAYATEAYRSEAGDTIKVKQHGNTIAVLSHKSVFVDNCGWDTNTTATRIRKVLDDNSIPYYVRIKNFSMRLYNTAHTELDDSFRSLEFVDLGYDSHNWAPNWETLGEDSAARTAPAPELSLY